MRVRSLGQEDPLEKGMVTHSILTWRISRIEEPGGFQSIGSQRVRQYRNDLACTHSWKYLGVFYKVRMRNVRQ